MKAHGAAGVISTQIAALHAARHDARRPAVGQHPVRARPRRRSAFKATPRAATRLRERLAAGPVQVHVTADTVFHRRPVRTLVAEFPGTRWPDDRVVLVAHVQEPGANDNASGSGTLLAAALALQTGDRRRRAAAPGAHADVALGRRDPRQRRLDRRRPGPRQGASLAMMSLDMTGEDTAKTGGTFLIEKGPDPTAVWARPSDPHREWGASEVDRALVRGSFLNDLHLAVALRRARDTGWVVRTNPYEGGSDHTSFTKAGVPALLNWHFTDRYYHTNLDTLDKVSAATMGHVATVVATTAMFLAVGRRRPTSRRWRRCCGTARDARLDDRAHATPRRPRCWTRGARGTIQASGQRPPRSAARAIARLPPAGRTDDTPGTHRSGRRHRGRVAAVASGDGQPAGAPPNVVVIFADDLGYGDLGAFGAPVIRTPRLDRMAAEGQKWTIVLRPAGVLAEPRRAAHRPAAGTQRHVRQRQPRCARRVSRQRRGRAAARRDHASPRC